MRYFISTIVLTIFTICNTFAVQIGAGSSSALYALQNEVAQLESELAQKQERLNKCAEKNKNFKIAGIATVGLAGAGVVANVAMAKKNQDRIQQIEKMNNKIAQANKIDAELVKKLNALKENLDENKFDKELEKLTDEEIELFENMASSFDSEDYVPTPAEQEVLIKYIKIMQASQKTAN